jgi:hypothetical protein
MDQPTIPFQFDPATVDLVIEGLSELPYKRVANTILAIATHTRDTLAKQREPVKRTRRAKPAETPQG